MRERERARGGGGGREREREGGHEIYEECNFVVKTLTNVWLLWLLPYAILRSLLIV